MASNSNSLPVSHSWKDQPCHFTWNLSAGVLTDFEKVIRNIDSDLKATPNLLRVDQLLFRAYLEVSDHRSRWNVGKAREFLKEADDYIKDHTGLELQPGYRSVALLNRIWIEHKSHRSSEVKKLLSDLDELEMCETDKLVVNTLLASALTRLGPTMITRSLQIYEEALQYFPDNAGFLYGALLMTGRKMRFERSVGSKYEDMDEPCKKLMDQEKNYCEKLMEGNDEYQLGKSYLGLNLSRRRYRREESRQLLEEAHETAPNVESVFNNLMRFYRWGDNADLERAISKYNSVLYRNNSNHNVPESYHQLALCYDYKGKQNKAEQSQWQSKALVELNECLRIEPMHIIASLKKTDIIKDQRNYDEANRLYDEMLQKSDHYPDLNKLDLYVNAAKARELTTEPTSAYEMWVKVMKLISSFDEMTGKGNKAKHARKAAFEKLFSYYQGHENEDLHLGILHFQNLDFEKAIEKLEKPDQEPNLDIPCYLAEAYLKWGREQKESNEPTDVRKCYAKARQNVYDAREQGQNLIWCRKLLSDTALAIAHLNLETDTSQHGPGQIQVESDCVESYREAVRCGSLVASVEVLRLIEKGFLKQTPRSKFLQLLAEIDICCSQRLSDCLHRDEKPRSFVKGLNSPDTDIDTFALNCKNIKRDILTMLHKNTFFGQAWKKHFAMEKEVLLERFQNNEGELELDGREESSIIRVSEEEMHAAVDCCEKLRPLLDHIIVMFEKDELGIHEEKKNQYFPLVFGKEDSVKTVEVLGDKLQSYFEIDFERHYPNLFQKLTQIQPGCNSQNDFLETFHTLVNHVKHSGKQTQEILKIVEDPVKLARQCTDKVEEICNFFVDAMKETSDLREKVEKLLPDLKVYSGHGSSRQEMDADETYKKADELLGILTNHEDFIVRMGSTWKLLEMLALIRQSRVHSDQEEAANKVAEGKWDLSKNLRKSHLELEVTLLQTANPSANDVLEKCRDTCKEADILLNKVMKQKRRGPQDDAEVEFPLRDMHPGSDTSSWKGKVKKSINKYLNEKGINPAKELLKVMLLKVMLQAQPCSDEENYKFLLMREFLKECDDGSGVIPNAVSIQTNNNEIKTLNAVELTRWCTDNAEKIASQVQLVT